MISDVYPCFFHKEKGFIDYNLNLENESERKGRPTLPKHSFILNWGTLGTYSDLTPQRITL